MRVKTLDELYGHANIKAYVKRCVEKDTLPNVMILHGNPGMGKSSLARLIAVEVATRNHPNLKADYVRAVIDDNISTDSIKLFNMSVIDSEEEIQGVKAEMSIGFSNTQRKVLILDEAHGMSKKAQDSILIELEHLPEGVYVIFCTTEIGNLRDSLVSRSKATLRLSDLTTAEIRKLIKSTIQTRQLSFSANQELVVSMISDWCGNQPRKAINLLESFDPGAIVAMRDLEVFLNIYSVQEVTELVKYLYGSLTLGINYIDSLKLDEGFVTALIEVTKVALGEQSRAISKEDTIFIRSLVQGNDTSNLLRLTAGIAELSPLLKRRVISVFIRTHVGYHLSTSKPNLDTETVVEARDFSVMNENILNIDVVTKSNQSNMIPTLEELFNLSEEV